MTGIFFEIPIEELTAPKDGYDVLVNKWWATKNGRPVGFKQTLKAKDTYPQCNSNKELAERIAKRLELEPPIFVEMAYWPVSD